MSRFNVRLFPGAVGLGYVGVACVLWSLVAARELPAQGVFIRGDCDQSRILDITDPISLLGYLFTGTEEPECLDACDANDSGENDISDAIYLLAFLFVGGPPPPPPFPFEDPDPTPDALDCLNGRVLEGELALRPPELVFHRLGHKAALELLVLEPGGEIRTVEPQDGVRFRSEDPGVAKVDDRGTVDAVGVGSARIFARYLGADAVARVEVVDGAAGGPTVRFTTPPQGALVPAGSITVAGIATPAEAEVRLLADGKSVPAERDGVLWSAEVELDEGTHVLEVRAQLGSKETRAFLELEAAAGGVFAGAAPDGSALPEIPEAFAVPPDAEPPVVRITEPRAGEVRLSSPVRVAGEVSEPVLEVRVNGVAAQVAGGSFELPALELPPGEALVRVEAIDLGGNVATAEVAFRIEPAWPRLEVLEPEPGPVWVVAPGSLRIEGRVDPPGTPVTAAGAAAQVSGDTFRLDLELSPGAHELRIAARSEPPAASRPRLFQRSVRVIADGEAPRLEFVHPPREALAPGAGYRTARAVLELALRASDPGVPPEAGGVLSVAASGLESREVAGPFRVVLPLAPGTQRFSIRLRDGRGLETVEEIEVTRIPSGQAPRLEPASPVVQSTRAGEPYPEPLRVRALGPGGTALRGIPVRFEVLGGSGTFEGGGREAIRTTRPDGSAEIAFQAGVEAGEAVHVVTASAPGFLDSPLAFVLDAEPAPGRILAAPGATRIRTAAGELWPPLEVALEDTYGNPVGSALVRFEVVAGGELLSGGLDSGGLATNAFGRVRLEGLRAAAPGRVILEALAEGADPVRFEVEVFAPGAHEVTEIAGTVEDERGLPVSGVQVRARGSTAPAALSASDGSFLLTGVPAGELVLEADAGAGFAPERLRVYAVAGRRTRLPSAIRLARRTEGGRYRALLAGPENPARFSLPRGPGFELTVPAGSARFPGGAGDGLVEVVLSPLTALPAPLPCGIDAMWALRVLPLEVRFEPSLPVRLPVPWAPDGAEVTVYRWDEVAGRFLALESAVVDARRGGARTRPGSGLREGGLYVAGRRGLSGKPKSFAGRAELVAPWFREVPQRPESFVCGFNVYAHSGEFFLEEVDLELPGRGLSYRFRRRYESRHAFRGSLGWGWEHEYADRRLFFLPGGNVVRADGAGNFDEYLWDAEAGVFVSPPAVFARLFRDEDGFFVERLPNGIRCRYHPQDGSRLAGRLESIADGFGNALRMVRDNEGRLAEVVDPLKRRIRYAYDGEGRIAEIRDPSGRTVTFEYDGGGNLAAVTGPAIEGTPNRNDFPAGRRTEYRYTSGFADERLNHNLTEIIPPREVSAGTFVPLVVNTYREDPGAPDADRVIAQVWGGTNATGVEAGGRTVFEYQVLPFGAGNAARASELEAYFTAEVVLARVTDREGRMREIRSNGMGLPLSLRVYTDPSLDEIRPREPHSLHPPPGTAPPWYETRWIWDAEGRLLRVEFPRGNALEYTYPLNAPLRFMRGFWGEERRIPAPGTDAEPEVRRRRLDPLFARAVWETPPHAPSEDPGPLALTRVLDYQEGDGVVELAREAGVDPADLAAALAFAGMELGLGDLNGDGLLGPGGGAVVREVLPPAAGNEGPAVREFTYNRYGQLVRVRGASGTVTRRDYYPETDPSGLGESRPEKELDALTGGYLKRIVVDTDAGDGGPPLRLETRFTYDAWGNIASVRKPSGRTVFMAYNAVGELVEERLAPPLKYRRWYFYDADGNLTEVRRENLRPTDSGSQLVVVENPWIETGWEYDLLGNPVTVTEEISGGETGPARVRITTLRYDREGRLARRVHPGTGRTRTWVYDERGLVIAARYGRPGSEEAQIDCLRDENGNVVRVVLPEDLSGDGARDAFEYRYDGFDRLTSVRDPAGGVDVFERGAGGCVKRRAFFGALAGSAPGEAPVLLAYETREYDPRGLLAERRRWRFVPGEEGAEAFVEAFRYDAEGRLRKVTGPAGTAVEHRYDAAGRCVESSGPGWSVRRVYDADGLLVKETLEEGVAPADPASGGVPDEGPVRSETYVYVYDERGRPVLAVDPGGGAWRALYDSSDRLAVLADATGPLVPPEAEPLLEGRLELLSEAQRSGFTARGNVTRYEWDGTGRLVRYTRELRADGTGAGALDTQNPYNLDGTITVLYEWDDDDLLASWTDDLGRRTVLERDDLGWVRRMNLPDGAAVFWERDAGGRPFEIRRGDWTIRQRFDPLGRLVDRVCELADGPPLEGTTKQRFAYDGLGRVTMAVDETASGEVSLVERRYDSLGASIEERQNEFTWRFERDEGGRAVRVRYPGGRTIDLVRDASGRIAQARETGRVFAAFVRFAASGLPAEVRYLGGVRARFVESSEEGGGPAPAYDARGFVLRRAYEDAGGDLLLGFEYGRDPNGWALYERRLHTPSRLGDAWRFDSAYRPRLHLPDLFDPRVPPVNPLRKIEITYDGNHNWRLVEVDQSRRFLDVDDADRYIEAGGETLEYDASGNLVRAGSEEYAYDALGRLIAVRRAGKTVARYRYDAWGAEDPNAPPGGRRVEKEVLLPAQGQPSGTTRYTWLESGLGEERDGQGALLRAYVRGPDTAPLGLLSHSGSGAPEAYAYLPGERASTAGLVSASGTLEESATYGLFGSVRVRNRFGSTVRFPATGNALWFGGLVYDFETGFHSEGGRYFDPRFGRFLTPAFDPAPRGPLGTNRYLHRGFTPLAGEVAGGGSPLRSRFSALFEGAGAGSRIPWRTGSPALPSRGSLRQPPVPDPRRGIEPPLRLASFPHRVFEPPTGFPAPPPGQGTAEAWRAER